MVQVLLWPETLWEKLMFHFRGISPAITCDEIRLGPGIVECVWHETNSCAALPMSLVLRVMWQGDYAQAVEKAETKYYDGIKKNAAVMGFPQSPIVTEGYR